MSAGYIPLAMWKLILCYLTSVATHSFRVSGHCLGSSLSSVWTDVSNRDVLVRFLFNHSKVLITVGARFSRYLLFLVTMFMMTACMPYGLHRERVLEPDALTLLFPSPVMRTHIRAYLPSGGDSVLLAALHKAINVSWHEYISSKSHSLESAHKLNDEFFEYQRATYGETASNRGWLATAAGKELLPVVDAVTRAYLSKLGVESSLAMGSQDFHIWASIHTQCSTHPRHVHPGATLSGVMYVAVPSCGGQLAFADPRGALPPFEPSIVHGPESGELILFPPWLPHEVTPSCDASSSEHDTPRISISFNYLSSRSMEEGAWGSVTAGFSQAAAPTRTAAGSHSGMRNHLSTHVTLSPTLKTVVEPITVREDAAVPEEAPEARPDMTEELLEQMASIKAAIAQLRQNIRRSDSWAAALEGRLQQTRHAQEAVEALLVESARLLEDAFGEIVQIEIQSNH